MVLQPAYASPAIVDAATSVTQKHKRIRCWDSDRTYSNFALRTQSSALRAANGQHVYIHSHKKKFPLEQPGDGTQPACLVRNALIEGTKTEDADLGKMASRMARGRSGERSPSFKAA
ncbi:hypothetical protein EVG20_g11192 [Dentipellis fragilis]|uniref:Uncharacterized protein n=1 Tax=Dentipellis fragilis TaxID=205917 RepID=A0A4Y9XR80_9AGAM|nr:hypothetical protein EVG20_g11192 [Dentipellis fragilis]